MQMRENMKPVPPEGLEPVDKKNFVRHFTNRDKAERTYFGEQRWPDCPICMVDGETLSSLTTAEFVELYEPDLVLVFGCGMIRDPLYSVLPKDTINLHLGLSPRYRGAATLFWPFYFLEPQYAGCTFHRIVHEPDAGDVIHQVRPELERGDHIHDVACKAVVTAADEALELLRIYESAGTWRTHKQQSTGKNYLASDFIPQHLRMIYNVYNDDIVDRLLDGHLPNKQINLFRQY